MFGESSGEPSSKLGGSLGGPQRNYRVLNAGFRQLTNSLKAKQLRVCWLGNRPTSGANLRSEGHQPVESVFFCQWFEPRLQIQVVGDFVFGIAEHSSATCVFLVNANSSKDRP